jgi:probable rRNA maturation factor
MICNFISQLKTKLPFSQKLAQKILLAAVRTLKIKSKFEVAVLIVGAKKIKELNKKFRHKNKVTDVLAFSQQEGEKIILPVNINNLGDIVICFPVLKAQAKKYHHSINQEFAFLLVHGFLHLLGYKDETTKQFAKMEKIQNKIVNKIYA